MVNPFPYSQSIINALERALSPERLSTYLAAAGQDHASALRLYVWNTRISAAFYGPLQALEINIRNAFHRELAAVYGAAWYDNMRVPLTPAARTRVADAKEAVRRAGRPLDPGRIIAELSFGFWERLLTHGPAGRLNYEMALWRPALRHTRGIFKRRFWGESLRHRHRRPSLRARGTSSETGARRRSDRSTTIRDRCGYCWGSVTFCFFETDNCLKSSIDRFGAEIFPLCAASPGGYQHWWSGYIKECQFYGIPIRDALPLLFRLLRMITSFVLMKS